MGVPNAAPEPNMSGAAQWGCALIRRVFIGDIGDLSPVTFLDLVDMVDSRPAGSGRG